MLGIKTVFTQADSARLVARTFALAYSYETAAASASESLSVSKSESASESASKSVSLFKSVSARACFSDIACASTFARSKLDISSRQFNSIHLFSRLSLFVLMFWSQSIFSTVEASPKKTLLENGRGLIASKPGSFGSKADSIESGRSSLELKGKKKVLRIEQKTVGYGSTTILIADDGIQFTIKTKGLKYYCLAPKWLLVIHNSKLNLAKEEPMRAWKGTSISKERITEISRSESSSSLYSLPGKRVKLEIAPVDSYFSKAEAMFRTSTRSAQKFKRMEYFVSDSIKLSKEQKYLADYVYGMTGAGGVILKEDLIDSAGKRFPVIETESIKEDLIPLSEWIYPKGYKPASWQELLNQKKDLEDAASILDTLYDGK